MKVGISLKIDVSKIDKSRLFKGEKGLYLDTTAFVDIDQLDQYGNSGMITQDVSKEEKQQGVQGAILGNSKVFWKGESQQQNSGYQNQQNPTYQQQSPQQQKSPEFGQGNSVKPFTQEPPVDFDDKIPF